MASNFRIKQTFRSVLDRYQEKSPDLWGNVVSISGSLSPPGKPEEVFVDLFGLGTNVVSVRRGPVLLEEGTPVQLEPDPAPPEYRVSGIYDRLVPSTGGTPHRFTVSNHSENHQIEHEGSPGPDPVMVYQPMLTPLKTEVSSGMTVLIYPYNYSTSTGRRVFPGTSLDLSSYVPTTANRAKRLLIYFDFDEGTVNIVESPEVPVGASAPFPSIPSGRHGRVSSWVSLRFGQTELNQASDILDGRDFLGGGNETLSSGSSLHDIVGSNHTVTGNAFDVVGLVGTDTLGLLTPSSSPGAAEALLKTDIDGQLSLERLSTKSIDVYDQAASSRVPGETISLEAPGGLTGLQVDLSQTTDGGDLIGGIFTLSADHPTGTVFNASGLIVDISNGGGTVSDLRGISLLLGNTGTTVSNAYGIYIEPFDGVFTQKYSIFTNDGPVSLGDSLEFRRSSSISTQGALTVSATQDITISLQSQSTLRIQPDTPVAGGWSRDRISLAAETSTGLTDFVRMGLYGVGDSFSYFWVSTDTSATYPWVSTSFVITGSGNVGIGGSTNPAEALTVQGNLLFSGGSRTISHSSGYLTIDSPSGTILRVGDSRPTTGGWARTVSLFTGTSTGTRDFLRVGIFGAGDSFSRAYITTDASNPYPWSGSAVTIRPNGYVGLGDDNPQSRLHLRLETEFLRLHDCGLSGGTEAGWIQVVIGSTTRYIRVFSTK